MTKHGESQTKKTLHELAKEFPNKTYRELEKYRDADRMEEAVGIGHNHPPDEGEEQDNPTLWELAKEHNVSYTAHWKRAMQMSVALFIHAWIPDVLQTYASNKMKQARLHA